MFENPFSFEGRIRRTEYGLSNIFYGVAFLFIYAITDSNKDFYLLWIAYIPMLWFLYAQGAKRCHDLGNSGWFQIIPFYSLWLLFQDSVVGTNEYGKNPKGLEYPNLSEATSNSDIEEQIVTVPQTRIEYEEYVSELNILNVNILHAKKKIFGADAAQREEIVDQINTLCENKEEAIYLLDSYSKSFGRGLIEDLLSLNGNGDVMAQNLCTFIDLKVIEPKYPFNRI